MEITKIIETLTALNDRTGTDRTTALVGPLEELRDWSDALAGAISDVDNALADLAGADKVHDDHEDQLTAALATVLDELNTAI